MTGKLGPQEQLDEVRSLNEQQRRTLKQLIIGRLFSMGARPTQPDDLKTFFTLKSLLLDLKETEPTQ